MVTCISDQNTETPITKKLLEFHMLYVMAAYCVTVILSIKVKIAP